MPPPPPPSPSPASPPPPLVPPESWFCGVEAAWQFFSAPLLPERCYFSATLQRPDLEEAGVAVFGAQSECSCIPKPPPPASPPSEIYFCGLPAVQQFFEQELNPSQCYYSYTLTRIQVMSQGVDVHEDFDTCQCVSPPPPTPRPPPPPAEPARGPSAALLLSEGGARGGRGHATEPGGAALSALALVGVLVLALGSRWHARASAGGRRGAASSSSSGGDGGGRKPPGFELL